MNMKDYKKLYENALDWVRKVYPTLEGADKEDAEHYFPELRESEDERIMEALLSHFKTYDISIGKYSREDIVAWLEKQKKPIDPEDRMNHPLYLDGFEVGRKVGRVEAEPAPSARQMMAERSNTPEGRECYEKVAEEMRKQIEQNPACDGCAKHLEGYIDGRNEAEKKLLEGYGILWPPDGELRIKPRWKPSDEQMEALIRARDYVEREANAGFFYSQDDISSLCLLINGLKTYFQ